MLCESIGQRADLSSVQEKAGSVASALAHAGRLLARDPALAAEQAGEILRVVPDEPQGLLILGSALGALGRTKEAAAALKRLVQRQPKHPQAWRMLGDALSLLGHAAAADQAYARHLQASVNDPRLLEAAAALCDGKLAIAERLLRDFLRANPTDIAAIRMLAETGARLGRYEDAEALLARALELAPSFIEARHNYAVVLYKQNKTEAALLQTTQLLKHDARNPGYRALHAAALGNVGEYGKAIAAYEALLKEFPDQPKAWLSYGHALKTLGRSADGIAAYRRAITLLPSFGDAYWSLANLKTFRFELADLDAMRAQLARDDLAPEDRVHLHFALGKALEDARDYTGAFAEYEKGNAIRRPLLGYEASDTTEHVRRAKETFTREFFAARGGYGCLAPDPIFIVGLTRAGSTLIEQILSSHSQVEGTMELSDIAAMARRLGGRKKKKDASAYPECLKSLSASECAALGEEYLARTRVQRKRGAPYFVDKMPANWAHAGFIKLILPKAKIIDARRHPLGCCFSNFKQHFARGQGHTYSLSDLGRYYADYVGLMAHFDRVVPGAVHRVFYERMIGDPEGEIRALLDYCGLAFEPACLSFHENERAVRTASSEQVRRPIYADSVEQWRNFEPWLSELKDALGPVLDAYPDVPPQLG
jgi:tetratricopeptide (TPR) repeat protein